MYENLLNSNEVYYIASFVFFKELFQNGPEQNQERAYWVI